MEITDNMKTLIGFKMYSEALEHAAKAKQIQKEINSQTTEFVVLEDDHFTMNELN